MNLVEQHIIKRSNPLFDGLDELCFRSKNLYNKALYEVRQQYFSDGSFLDYYKLNRLLHDRHDVDYFSLPSNTSQETLKLVCQNYKSFFGSLKSKKVTNKVKIPGYLDKQSGRQTVVYNKMTLSKKYLEQGIIRLPKSNIEFKSNHCCDLSQVRLVPKGNYIVIEVIYDVEEQQIKASNERYLSIDLGVNNLAACTSNVLPAFIVNGRPLKSINQYYNKKKAHLQSKLKKDQYTSQRIKNLTLKRNNKIKDYFHKASTLIVNHAVSNDLNVIVIGKNTGWKQDIKMWKKDKQTFTQIPFEMLIRQISYKAMLQGIKVVLQEESYTSKCSFIENDYLPTYGVDDQMFKATGKRVKRGLYKTKTSALNADVNGSLNILRKYLKVSSDLILPIGSRGLVTRPVMINIANQKH